MVEIKYKVLNQSFHLRRDDLIATIKIPLNVDQSVLIIRKVFKSNVVLLKFRDEKRIILPDRVDILSSFEDGNIKIIGEVSDKFWRLRLIFTLPYLGSQFVKLWDTGKFELNCRE